MDSNMVDDAESDLKKFTYHESARIIRTVLERICEFTYTGDAPTHDECETLCDMLIELHQLLYGITLHTLRSDDPDADRQVSFPSTVAPVATAGQSSIGRRS